MAGKTSPSIDLGGEDAGFAAFWMWARLSGKKWELLSPEPDCVVQPLSSCVMLGELLCLFQLVNLICKMVIKVSGSELGAHNSAWQMSAGMFTVNDVFELDLA